MSHLSYNIITILGKEDIIFPYLEKLSDPKINYDAEVKRKNDLGNVKYYLQTFNEESKILYEKIAKENPDTPFAIESADADDPEKSSCTFYFKGGEIARIYGDEMYGYQIQGFDLNDIFGNVKEIFKEISRFFGR